MILKSKLKKNYSIKFNKIVNKIANLYIIRDYWRFNTNLDTVSKKNMIIRL